MTTRMSRWFFPILVAMALVGGPLPGHAQGPQIGTPPGLSLTPAQQARAQARMQQFARDVTALQADKTITPAQKMAKAKTLYQTRDTDMLAILTPAQRAQVLAQRKAVADKQASFNKTHQAEISAGSGLANRLNKSLTQAQKTQIDGIRKQLTVQYQGLSVDKTLSNQAKQQKLLSDQQDAQTKILAVLTPTQKTDYLKMQQMQKQLLSEAGGAQPGH